MCSGVSSWEQCRYSLPEVGIYIIVACLPEMHTCYARLLGRSQAEWAAEPLSQHPPTAFQFRTTLTQRTYFSGQVAEMDVEVPVAGARALVFWASATDSGTVEADSVLPLNNSSQIIKGSDEMNDTMN